MDVQLFDMLLCISSAVDLIMPELSSHHHQVAYLSYRIAQRMQLSDDQKKDIITAALLHDIGALTSEEKLRLIEEEPVTINSHAFRSARLLNEVPILSSIVDVVRFHHVRWNGGEGKRFQGKDVSLLSQIIYLADRTCMTINSKSNVIDQIPLVAEFVAAETGRRFLPDAAKVLLSMKNTEHIWLELTGEGPLNNLPINQIFGSKALSIDELLDVTRMFSFIIDFRSHFTATHSAGVAHIASELALLSGFSDFECKMMLIAGYLHDLGKLIVPPALLEKPAALSNKEYDIIRAHTFYTYKLLEKIKGFEAINMWASYHHEKLSGNGYPFHLSADRIPLGSRIMAVADVFTAVTENRPYRKSMSPDQITKVLISMVDNGSICRKIVELLLPRMPEFIKLCHESQRREAQVYESLATSA